jgi:molybdopterin/thiamine biosynthesis adenylyltransferase
MLSESQRQRYARHILLPEVGEEGQAKLLTSKALVVGAGGLGSPVALYLAAAGVGTLGIVDDDVVYPSNLQRQIIHSMSGLGTPKVESAARTIVNLNTDVKVVTYPTRLTKDNIEPILMVQEYDVIVDCCDNLPTRYLINEAAAHLKKPWVHGAVSQLEGCATTILPGKGPCYQCIYPASPPPSDGIRRGVLGVVTGIIGVIQATEVLKVLLGIGTTLSGRLLVYSALRMSFQELTVARNKKCPICKEI